MPGSVDPEALRRQALDELRELAAVIMPFGRYQGRRLVELPAEYLQAFAKEWPKGRLGEQMRTVYQMKADGSGVAFDLFTPRAGTRKADE